MKDGQSEKFIHKNYEEIISSGNFGLCK